MPWWILTGPFKYLWLILAAVGTALAALARARSQGRAQERARQEAEEARRIKVRENIDAEVARVPDSELDARLERGGWLRK